MNTEEHRWLREQLGAYVLGQLRGAELAELEMHLAGCPACRAEAAELAPVARSLRHIDPEDLGAAPAPPAELEIAIMTQIRRDRSAARRARWVRRSVGGLLVAASLTGAFLFGAQLDPFDQAPPVRALALHSVDGVRADGGVVRHTWGTELQLRATGLAEGSAYGVTFVSRNGSTVSAGTLLGTGDRPVRCSVNAAVRLDDAVRVQVRDTDGAVVIEGRID